MRKIEKKDQIIWYICCK